MILENDVLISLENSRDIIEQSYYDESNNSVGYSTNSGSPI